MLPWTLLFYCVYAAIECLKEKQRNAAARAQDVGLAVLAPFDGAGVVALGGDFGNVEKDDAAQLGGGLGNVVGDAFVAHVLVPVLMHAHWHMIGGLSNILLWGSLGQSVFST